MFEEDTLLSDLKDYESFLKRAYAEGWRDPIQITDMELRAYAAGMKTERNRVLHIFKDLENKPIMRIFDLTKYLDRVRNPNNPV